VVARAVRRDDFRGTRIVRHQFAGLCGWRLPADFLVRADLRRIRWLVDRKMRHELREHNLDEHQLAAEGDKSPGVLLASGYIAGGAIAGIIIALVQGVMTDLDGRIGKWANAFNPFYASANADWLALIPFVLLVVFLYFVGRGKLLVARQQN
jgi:hypothetical protein